MEALLKRILFIVVLLVSVCYLQGNDTFLEFYIGDKIVHYEIYQVDCQVHHENRMDISFNNRTTVIDLEDFESCCLSNYSLLPNLDLNKYCAMFIGLITCGDFNNNIDYDMLYFALWQLPELISQRQHSLVYAKLCKEIDFDILIPIFRDLENG